MLRAATHSRTRGASETFWWNLLHHLAYWVHRIQREVPLPTRTRPISSLTIPMWAPKFRTFLNSYFRWIACLSRRRKLLWKVHWAPLPVSSTPNYLFKWTRKLKEIKWKLRLLNQHRPSRGRWLPNHSSSSNGNLKHRTLNKFSPLRRSLSLINYGCLRMDRILMSSSP